MLLNDDQFIEIKKDSPLWHQNDDNNGLAGSFRKLELD